MRTLRARFDALAALSISADPHAATSSSARKVVTSLPKTNPSGGWRILAAFLCMAAPLAASTNGTSGNFKYTDYGTYITITGTVSSPSGAIVIPSQITSKDVTGIASNAFAGCSNLTGVTIPSTVTSIGNNAFQSCTKLASVTIPSTVTSIGSYAFGSCLALTSAPISTGVTSIGNDAFQLCTGLTSVTIPASVTTIGTGVFNSCTGLTAISVDPANLNFISSADGVVFNKLNDTIVVFPAGRTGDYTIPSNVKYIKTYAFDSCVGLTSVTIPSSVTSIGSYAFNSCTGLTGMTIPSSVTAIGDYAFSSCTGLTSVTIPSGVTSIGVSVFMGCTGLTSVTIPSSVISIGNSAFSSCSGLTSVTIPPNVASIGYGAFSSCTGLTSVTIPSSVTSIGALAFSSCTGLAVAEFLGDAPTTMATNAFSGDASGFTVEYHTGKAGFTSPTWKGYPAINVDTRIIGVSGNLAFGSVTVNSTATAVMAVSNTGDAPLTVSGISYPTGFSGNWTGGTIAAGLTQNVTLTFSPTAVQAYGGNVSVSSNSTSGTGTITASGQGGVPPPPYATWQGTKFTAADILTGLTTMAADFEGDGMPNLLEYAFGTDPKTPNPSPVTVNVSGSNLQISFPCNTTCTDITYTVQASSDLSAWTDIAKSSGGATAAPIGTLSTVSDSGTGLRTVTVIDSATLPAAGGRFLRIKVSSP